MKKLAALLCAWVLLLTCGCGKTEFLTESTSETVETTAQYNVSEQTVPARNFTVDDLKQANRLSNSDSGNEKVYTFGLPDNLEFVPMFEDEVAMYMDAAHKKPYVYPGNGTDYAFYITTEVE